MSFFEDRKTRHGARDPRWGEQRGLRQVWPAEDSMQDRPWEGIWALSSKGQEGSREEGRARPRGFSQFPGSLASWSGEWTCIQRLLVPQKMGQWSKPASGPGEAECGGQKALSLESERPAFKF